MKTAEKWMQELAFRRKNPEDCNAIVTQGIIQQIQMDAWRQGMMDAAEIADDVKPGHSHYTAIIKAMAFKKEL
jgi:hypothetical protein